mmetsp:Transcript_15779/g.17814  ORF Transcript_15779/g.17814 Transcript_15779/m.17814 type:complete len:229 (+) Transcript_15779:139-825(+)
MGRRRRLSDSTDEFDSEDDNFAPKSLAKRGTSLVKDSINFAKRNQNFVFNGFIASVVSALLLVLFSRGKRDDASDLIKCVKNSDTTVRCRPAAGYVMMGKEDNLPEYFEFQVVESTSIGIDWGIVVFVLFVTVGAWFLPRIESILDQIMKEEKLKKLKKENKKELEALKTKASAKRVGKLQQTYGHNASKNKLNDVSDVSDTDYEYEYVESLHSSSASDSDSLYYDYR